MTTRNDLNDVYLNGSLVSSTPVTIDTTIETTAATITTQATTAIGLNRTFLALVTPTNAEVVAQVRRLARQNNGIIRLLVNRASLVDGVVD